MKKILIVLFMFVVMNSSFAQFYELTLHDTIGQAPPLQNIVLDGYIKNLTNDSLHVKMVRLQNNLPSASWMSFMCLRFCLPPNIDSVTTMDPGNYAIPPGDSVFVEVLFLQTDSIPGTATAQVKFATIHDDQVDIIWFEGSTLVTGIHEKSAFVNTDFFLFNNYPNPFNNQTIISAKIDYAGKVKLQIYDILGREVYRVIDNSSAAGIITFRWDGISNDGYELSSGIYLYKLSTFKNGIINHSNIKKLTLLR